MKKTFFICCLIMTTCLSVHAQQHIVLDHDMPIDLYLSLPIINPQDLQSILPTSNPAKSFNSIELYAPEVGDQGAMGSCVTWALCYCAGSIIAYEKYGNMNEAKRSPAFLFNQYKVYTSIPNNCSQTGCYMENIIDKSQTEGVCSYNMMPYIQNDCSTQPDSLQKFDAYLNRFSVGRLSSAKNDTLFRDALSNGYPIVVDIKVYNSFDNMWNYGNGIWTTNDTTTTLRGYHTCCVIGYDNSTQRFKVQNSWGTSGGAQGYFYVSYNLVKQGCFSRAYIISDITKNVYPSIVGHDILCDSSDYTIADTISGMSYQWSYDNYSFFDFYKPFYITSYGDHAIVRRGIMANNQGYPVRSINPTVPYVGTRTLLVSATHNGACYTMSKEINMLDSVVPHFNCSITLPTRIAITFTEDSCTNIDSQYLSWSIKKINVHGANITVATGIGRSITYRATTAGTYKISVSNSYSCPTTTYSRTVTYQSNFIQSEDDNNDSYVEIYNIMGNLVTKYKLYDNMDIPTLNKGIYVIKVINKGTIFEDKLIIND